MYRDVADAKSWSPKHCVDDNGPYGTNYVHSKISLNRFLWLLYVFQIRLSSLSSLTTTNFLDQNGIKFRVDGSSKEATSDCPRIDFDFCLSTSIPVLTTSTRVVAWLLPQLKVECTFCSDVCGTFEALTQRIQMYRDVADAKSWSPKHCVDDNGPYGTNYVHSKISLNRFLWLLYVFQIRLSSLSSLTTTNFLDQNGIKFRVDGSSKEATSEFISKTKAILYGGEGKTAGNS